MRQGRKIQVEAVRGVSINTLAFEYPPDCNVPEHVHISDQLIYATRGVMQVRANESFWLIPPQFAVWIPARTLHRLHMPGAVSMRSLYLRPGLAKTRQRCAVLHVTPLLRELIVEAARIGALKPRVKLHAALAGLIVAHIEAATAVPTSLVMPKDRRAASLAQETVDDPARSPSFAVLCRRAGVSVRTMERVFRREVGTDFETWRRQARLMKAVELLVSGRSVKETAARIGYRGPSAFVAMFRAAFGQTPKAWVSGLSGADRSAI